MCLGFWVCQGSKYLGLHMNLNKILHHRYLTSFWICIKVWTCQCYTGFCRKQPIVHVRQSSEYSGSQYARAWRYMLHMVLCIVFCSSVSSQLQRVLNKILHRIYLAGFWIYHRFKICQGSECTRVLNMPEFIKKTLHHADAWQGSEYFSGPEYARALNMSGLRKVLKRMVHHRCLTGFTIFFRFWV